MYIIMVNYIKSLEEVNKELKAHRDFLDKYYALQKLVFSGRRNPVTGGVILCNAKDKKEVETIIEEDPFYINKIAEYEIIEFSPTKCVKGLEHFLCE